MNSKQNKYDWKKNKKSKNRRIRSIKRNIKLIVNW